MQVLWPECQPLPEMLTSACRRPQVCNHLERLSVDLEAAAHPALDALTRKVPHRAV